MGNAVDNVVDVMLSPVDKILNCGNQSDVLAARERELEQVRAEAEDFRELAEAYKRQLDDALAKGGAGILKNSSSKNSSALMSGRNDQVTTDPFSRNTSGKSLVSSNSSSNGRKIAFTDEQTNGGRPTSEKKNLRMNPSLFSYNPSGRI